MSPPPTEPFAVLGLPRDAAEAEVKKAYRNLALVNHPEKAGPTGLEKMKQINVAYELIIDRKLCKPQRATPTSPAPKPKPPPTPKQESDCDSDSDSHSDDADDPNPDWKPDRHEWSELLLGEIHRKLTDFIMNNSGIDPRFKHRSPRSNTHHDADRLHYHLSRLHGLNETKTGKVCQRPDLGELLNQIVEVMVSDAKTLDDARAIFEMLDLDVMAAREGYRDTF